MVRAATGVPLDEVDKPTRAESKYVADEVEVFCRNKAIEEAIYKGPELLQKGDFSQILDTLKAAISVGLQKDIGIDYFTDPEERLKRTLETQARISTGWPELDKLIGGGLNRQELITFLANSGGGKSMTMLNLGKNLLMQGYHGAYISLEMGEPVVSKRLDSMITGIGQDALLKQMHKAASLIEKASGKMGRFVIKRLPENRTNIHHVRSYLEQLEQARGFRPDFIIVDYIDIMGTTHNIQADNLFIKDKFVTEEIRSLGFDFDAMMISAAQLGRAAIDAEKLTQAHIQGGISKINTSDYVIGVKQDDLMRASGEIYFECLKSRNSAGVGKRELLSWDPISLNIGSLQKNSSGLKLAKPKAAILGTEGTIFSKKDEGGSSIVNMIDT
jgi:replicative DNA helicase